MGNFLSPARLWLLVAVGVLALAYVAAQRRRPRYAVRFPNLELLASVVPRSAAWRRHLPAAAALAAFAFLVLGFARPTRAERIPQKTATVVLAIDTSLSMAATDVEPDRLTAAQRAARSFVENLPGHIRLGLVSFDGTARVLVAPTLERDPVTDAVERLSLGPSTATGDAVFASLGAIGAEVGPAAGEQEGQENPAARIVLMSDGKLTAGRSAESAVAAATTAGVPVSTIAFGTDDGIVEVQGQIIPVPVDRPALEDMAEETGGGFFEADSVDELREVYSGIGRTIGFEVEDREVTAAFVTVAAVLLALAAMGSLLWTSRLP